MSAWVVGYALLSGGMIGLASVVLESAFAPPEPRPSGCLRIVVAMVASALLVLGGIAEWGR